MKIRKASKLASRARLVCWLILAILANGTLSFLSAQGLAARQDPQPSAIEPKQGANNIAFGPEFKTRYRSIYDSPGISMLTPTEGVNFNDYLKQVMTIVKLSWYGVMPVEAWKGQKGITSIVFRIERDGTIDIKSMELGKSSGSETLDKAAMDGIRDAKSFEPLPEQFKGRYIALRFNFFYNIKMDTGGNAPDIKSPAEMSPTIAVTDPKPPVPPAPQP